MNKKNIDSYSLTIFVDVIKKTIVLNASGYNEFEIFPSFLHTHFLVVKK